MTQFLRYTLMAAAAMVLASSVPASAHDGKGACPKTHAICMTTEVCRPVSRSQAQGTKLRGNTQTCAEARKTCPHLEKAHKHCHKK